MNDLDLDKIQNEIYKMLKYEEEYKQKNPSEYGEQAIRSIFKNIF